MKLENKSFTFSVAQASVFILCLLWGREPSSGEFVEFCVHLIGRPPIGVAPKRGEGDQWGQHFHCPGWHREQDLHWQYVMFSQHGLLPFISNRNKMEKGGFTLYFLEEEGMYLFACLPALFPQLLGCKCTQRWHLERFRQCGALLSLLQESFECSHRCYPTLVGDGGDGLGPGGGWDWWPYPIPLPGLEPPTQIHLDMCQLFSWQRFKYLVIRFKAGTFPGVRGQMSP